MCRYELKQVMLRDGFAFSTRVRVRYAEIDGQKVVFNSRYLEYADVAITEFWDWTGIGDALGAAWSETEFHVRRAEVDYLRPFVLGDTVEAWVRIERIGTSSLTNRLELTRAGDAETCAAITLVSVNVHLPTGRPVPLSPGVRAYLQPMISR